MSEAAQEAEVGRSPRRPRFRPYRGESGLGGFMLLFAITQMVGLAVTLFRVPSTIGTFGADGRALAAHVPLLGPLLVYEAVGTVATIAAMAYGLWLLLRLKPATPRFYSAFLGAFIVYAVVEGVLSWVVYGQFASFATASGEPLIDLDARRFQTIMTTVRSAGYATIWLAYWRQSSRVHNTFPATA